MELLTMSIIIIEGKFIFRGVNPVYRITKKVRRWLIKPTEKRSNFNCDIQQALNIEELC